MHLFPALGPWGISSLRIGVAALVTMCAVRPKFWKWTREQWTSSILLGLAVGMMNGVFYSSLAKLPLGFAVAFEFVGPLVLAIILSRRAIDAVWISFAVVGMALLGLDSRSEDINVYGIFLALLAGFFWACYILASEKVGRVFHDAEGLSVGLVVALLVTLPLGAKGAAVAFTDIHLLGFAVITGLTSSLEPVFAALGGMLLLHQSTGAIRWAAIAILVAASVGVTLTHRTKSTEVEFDDNEMMLESMPATGAIPIIIQRPQETEIEEHDSLANRAHIELEEQVEEERVR